MGNASKAFIVKYTSVRVHEALAELSYGDKLINLGVDKRGCDGTLYKTTILPVVLYGCQTWSLTLRKEHRLRVFENSVLRRIFGQKRDEVTGEWRKLHNEKLRDL
jgi:hypothetical protein